MTLRTVLRLQAVRACLLFAVLVLTARVRAQAPSPAAEAKEPGHVVLVLPFDNRSGNPSLAWIGDSFPDTLNQRLSSAGFLPITRADRQFALDHLGLPVNFRPTRATSIRIAQNLDADYVVVGSFNIENNRLQVQAQVLEVDRLRLSPPLQDSTELARLLDVENAIAWKVARQINPNFPVAEQTFLAASAGVQLSAFENYIRGTDNTNSVERVRRLEAAVKESPGYADADLALGKELYTSRDYDQSAAALARVPRNDRLALEANFYIGLARFNEAKYADAENAFSFVASRLPLPEVVNDIGVAQARQGKDSAPVLQRASNADPNDPDYHYNLAVSHYKHNDMAGAVREADLTLKLRPKDTEATQLRNEAAAGHPYNSGAGVNNTGFEPVERLRRTYSEVSFRQAAAQLDDVRAMRLATLPPDKQAAEYVQQGRDYLTQGLLPEAEKEFHFALMADPRSAAAHAGLADVREHSGNIAEARVEAQASLNLAQNIDAYLILARIELAANNLPASAVDVKSALHLDPSSGAAQGMRNALASRGQAIPQ